MKIISGYLKGRKLEGYDILGTRPTMDRVKESLFGMIQNDVAEAICLDLFSGSGNLGIEAISQGANFSYLVDHNPRAIQYIKKNVSQLSIENKVKILFKDYIKALNSFQGKKFDLIFLDPPYQTNCIEKSLELIEKYDLLSLGGLVICESSDIDKVIYSSYYSFVKSKKYGDKSIVILKKV